MSKYKLISFDMDGTLLNSKKEITKKSKEKIKEATENGKVVTLSTGRCVPELKKYINQIPNLRYIICVSGASVYDLKEKKKIYENPIPVETVKKLLAIAKKRDVMVHILSDRSVVQKDKLENMDRYNMGHYQNMFEEVSESFEDVYEFYMSNPYPVEKFNFYNPSIEVRDEIEALVKDMNVMYAYSEKSNLEISAKGVTKGTGLKALCKHLGIDIAESIAVGDANNDMDILRTAGLAVAMGNADDSVKEISDVVVDDCDSEGCAQAIEEYLLK